MPGHFQVCWTSVTGSLDQPLEDCYTTYAVRELTFMMFQVQFKVLANKALVSWYFPLSIFSRRY